MSTVNYHTLAEQVQHYAQTVFETKTDPRLVYHDIAHTRKMVEASAQIANHYQLSDRDFFIVHTASWFHDLGYFSGGAANHEEKGAAIAEAFLKGTGLDEEAITMVKNAILATKMPQSPHTLLEEIVCDADLFHLGTDDFSERNKQMRREAALVNGHEITKDAWRVSSIAFLEKHSYHTDYARLLLDAHKQKNLAKLKYKQSAIEENSIAPVKHPENIPVVPLHPSSVEQPYLDAAPKTGEQKKEKKKKDERPEKGIETVFRITSSNNQKLSSQADSKAHIMIQVNSIIISVLLSVMLRKIEDYPHLIIPAIMLLTVNLVTIVFSILATRPHIPKGSFTQKDIDEKKVNLLFFGNFYKMPLEEYNTGMLKLMEDHDFLYGSLIKDVYFQGVALGQKYKWLRLSYNIFMFGLIIAVITFIAAAIAIKAK